jgi:hypothetical protein
MLGTIVLTAAPALGASERERFEAGKPGAVYVSTAAGAALPRAARAQQPGRVWRRMGSMP